MERIAESGVVPIGRVTTVFGVRGWLKCWSWTDPPENFLRYSNYCSRLPGGDWQALPGLELQRHGRGLLLRPQHCDDRDRAREFIGLEIGVDRAQLEPLAENTYYWFQLEGLAVMAVAEDLGEPRLLGRIDHLFSTGANDVMVIDPCERSIDERQRLVPWVRDTVVREVDLERGVITVDWDPAF